MLQCARPRGKSYSYSYGGDNANPSSPKLLLALIDRAYSLVVEGYIHMGVVIRTGERDFYCFRMGKSKCKMTLLLFHAA